MKFLRCNFQSRAYRLGLTTSMKLSTQVLKCDPASISFQPGSENPDVSCSETLQALRTASHHLVDLLQPVAFPTETVYGLGALALNPSAVSRIFTTKGRPSDNPLIVHVSSLAMLRTLLPKDYSLSRPYQVLLKHFWPGALTLLFPRDPDIVPRIISANQPTVAVRMPSHLVARALIAVANAPIAAPSANLSGKPSPTQAKHVLRDLEGRVGVILDGGACDVGVESTVVDGLNDDGNLRVLRPGGVSVEDIQRVLEEDMQDCERIPQVLVHRRDYDDELIEQAPTTPGMKYRHYSPAVPVVLLYTSPPPAGITNFPALPLLASLKSKVTAGSRSVKIGILTPTDSSLAKCALPCESIHWRRYFLGPISKLSVIAHHLFDGLLTLESEGVDLIVVEEVPEVNEGLAVMNRLKKAATESIWIDFCQKSYHTN